MAKAKKPKKERAPKYEEKQFIAGSFKDIMKAAVKDANTKKESKKP